MMPLAAAAAEFLSHKRIAIAGVSASGANAANVIYRRVREDGYQVFAVNPHADHVEGDVSYHLIGEIPGASMAWSSAPPRWLRAMHLSRVARRYRWHIRGSTVAVASSAAGGAVCATA